MFGRKEQRRIRVLVVDDYPAVAEGLRVVLEPELDVIATVGNGNALVAAAATLTPDVIVTDIAMPGLDGIAAASEILHRRSHIAGRSCLRSAEKCVPVPLYLPREESVSW